MVLAAPLPNDPATLQATLIAERAAHAAELKRLTQIIKELQRYRFGRCLETLPIAQLELALEEVQQGEAEDAVGVEMVDPQRRAARTRTRRANREALPAHLPRIEVVVNMEDKTCPCCNGALHRIGEYVAERPDLIPAQLRVLVARRPKYACRTCE